MAPRTSPRPSSRGTGPRALLSVQQTSLRCSVHRAPGGSGGAEPRRPVLPPSCPHIRTQSTSETVLSNPSVSGPTFTASEGPPAGAAVRTPGPLNLATHVSPDPGFFICKVEMRIVISAQGCVRATGRGARGRDCKAMLVVIPSTTITGAMACPRGAQMTQQGLRATTGTREGSGCPGTEDRAFPKWEKTFWTPHVQGCQIRRVGAVLDSDGITGPMGPRLSEALPKQQRPQRGPWERRERLTLRTHASFPSAQTQSSRSATSSQGKPF